MARNRTAAIGVLAFAMFIDLMDVTIVNVTLPVIQRDLGASAENLTWIVGGYALAFAALLVTGARLGDIYGRRRVFILGVLAFTVASLGAATAATGDLLVAARLAQGAAAALMVPQLLSNIQALFRPSERAPLFGLVGVLAGLAAVVGPLLGGWLVTSDAFGMGWRSVFVINVPIGVLIALLAWLVVPETRSEHADSLDLIGVVLLSLGVGGLVYALVEGRQLGWPGWLVCLLCLVPVVLGLFVVQQRRRERRDEAPLLPMRLFADRGYSAGLVTQMCCSAAMVGLFLVLAVYVQTGLQFTPWQSGLTLLPYSVGSFIGTSLSVPLGGKLGKILTVTGALLMAAGSWWTTLIAANQGTQLQWTSFAAPLVVAGAGLGLIVVPLVDIALATVPLRDAGAASGALSTIQQIGSALGVAVIGLVFFAVAGTFTQPELLDGYIRAGHAAALGFVVCAAASLWLPSVRDLRHRQQEVAAVGADLAAQPAVAQPSA